VPHEKQVLACFGVDSIIPVLFFLIMAIYNIKK